MFDIIVLSLQRKFLSRRSCSTEGEAGQFVAAILRNAVVGSLSIKRVAPKEEPGTSDPLN